MRIGIGTVQLGKSDQKEPAAKPAPSSVPTPTPTAARRESTVATGLQPRVLKDVAAPQATDPGASPLGSEPVVVRAQPRLQTLQADQIRFLMNRTGNLLVIPDLGESGLSLEPFEVVDLTRIFPFDGPRTQFITNSAGLMANLASEPPFVSVFGESATDDELLEQVTLCKKVWETKKDPGQNPFVKNLAKIEAEEKRDSEWDGSDTGVPGQITVE